MDALATAPDLTNDGEELLPALPAPPAWLEEEAWVLEPPPADERHRVMRDEAALLLDRLLVRVARGRGALDVAVGEGLAALAVGGRVFRLGYSSIGDYARERLGIGVRSAQAMARLARELRSRPLLREAVHRGEVSARKAQAVLPLAIGEAEAEWVARARTDTVRALAAAARAHAPVRDGEEDTWERLDIAISSEGRATVDEALAVAGKLLGARAPKWQRIEALCQEYLGAHPVEPLEDEKSAGSDIGPSLEDIKEGLEAEMQQWRWLEEIHASGPRERGPGPPLAAPVPDSADEPFVDVIRLDADLRRFAAMRDRWDELLGHLAMLLQWTWLWRDMGFARFSHYCAERLGMAGRTVTQRTALERKLYSLPKLREVLRARQISYEKARLVASVADEASLDGWIALAQRSTCIALRRLIDAREEGQMCAPPAGSGSRPPFGAAAQKAGDAASDAQMCAAPSVAPMPSGAPNAETVPLDAHMCALASFTLRVPRTVGVLLFAVMHAAREAEGRWISTGECLLRVAEHFIETWAEAVPRSRTLAQRVLARDRAQCQVPGCSRAAAHAHHVTFRSAGGSDEDWNLVSLCVVHHLHGIHAGYVRVSGRAPHALTWELGLGYDGAPLEVFEPTPVH